MKCRLRFVTTAPLLIVNIEKGAGVIHFRFQECFQEKKPIKRDFFEELKAEGGFSILIVSRRIDCNKYYTQ